MKIKLFIVSLLIAMLGFIFVMKQSAAPLQLNAKAAMLIDAATGRILYEKNADESLAPASMSKMMTEYIVLEQLQHGKLHWNDRVKITAHAASIEGARIQLRAGQKVTVRDLYTAMVVASANNATVALAEYIAGTEADFSELMNEKARIFKLKDSLFINATGLTEGSKMTRMSAKDLARLAKLLVSDFPEVLQTTTQPHLTLQFSGEGIYSTNQMLTDQKLAVEGLDGLKTGFTDQAGYCFTGTAGRDGHRLISVVMGTENTEERFVETKKLMDWGFTTVYNESNRSILE